MVSVCFSNCKHSTDNFLHFSYFPPSNQNCTLILSNFFSFPTKGASFQIVRPLSSFYFSLSSFSFSFLLLPIFRMNSLGIVSDFIHFVSLSLPFLLLFSSNSWSTTLNVYPWLLSVHRPWISFHPPYPLPSSSLPPLSPSLDTFYPLSLPLNTADPCVCIYLQIPSLPSPYPSFSSSLPFFLPIYSSPTSSSILTTFFCFSWFLNQLFFVHSRERNRANMQTVLSISIFLFSHPSITLIIISSLSISLFSPIHSSN